MKKIYLSVALLIMIFATSCKASLYDGGYGQINQTQIVLSKSNFNVLGSFTGVAMTKKRSMSIKDKSGLISLAKANLLENAKNSGIELKGSRTLTNVSTDIVQNSKHVKVVMTAEIIEFTD